MFHLTCRFNKDGHLELLNDGFVNNSVNILFLADLIHVKNRISFSKILNLKILKFKIEILIKESKISIFKEM